MDGSIPKAKLGRTGLDVTRLGFGSMELRGDRLTWGGRPVTDEGAEKLLNAVLDSGINFIDTANCYGESEDFIGRFISRRRREYLLATKCGHRLVRQANGIYSPVTEHDRKNYMRSVDDSLKRMKTDHIDIMQMHNPPVDVVNKENLVGALQDMKKSGKVRFTSISTTLPHLPEYLKMGVFDTFQIPYSGLYREHEEWITKSAKEGIGTIIRGGVQRGEPKDRSNAGKDNPWNMFGGTGLDGLMEEGENRTQFMLRLTLSNPDVHTVIVGTLDTGHLQENLKAAAKGPLSADVYAEARKRLDAAGFKAQ